MEVLDLYNDYGEKLDETIIRGEKTLNGKNIMLSVIYIQNNEGKYLIQKTSKEKGGKYSTTGGHVMHGENALDTIQRELKEELGIRVRKNLIKHITTFKYPDKNCIFNVYYMKFNDNNISMKLQKEEVESIYFLSDKKIKNLIDNNKFLESHAYIFNNYININKE